MGCNYVATTLTSYLCNLLTLIPFRVWSQLSGAAAHCQVHQQNQHELRQLDRTGGHPGGSHAVPMEPGLHYQVSSSRAPPPHAPQGQHEAVSAPGGLHLLRVENFELGVQELSCGGAHFKFAPTTLNSPRRQHHPVASII